MKRHLLSVLIATLLVACALALPAAKQAHAATLLSCTGTQTDQYDPPMTNTMQTIKLTITDDYDSCSVLGDPTLTSGNATFTITTTISCLVSLSMGDNQVTYHWNSPTNHTSSIDFPVTEAPRLADGTTQVTSTGTVTSGFDAGASATRVILMPELDATECSQGGVSVTTGPDTLTVI